MALTLYGGPQTRASMPRWYLEEKGIPYELVEIDLRGNQHRQPEYLAINPFWKNCLRLSTTACWVPMDNH